MPPATPTFFIEQRDGYFAFTFYTETGNLVFSSHMFRTQRHCLEGIKDLIAAVTRHSGIQKLEGRGGEYSFMIRNKRQVTLGYSPVYYAAAPRNHAIRQLELQVSRAIIKTTNDEKVKTQFPINDQAN